MEGSGRLQIQGFLNKIKMGLGFGRAEKGSERGFKGGRPGVCRGKAGWKELEGIGDFE